MLASLTLTLAVALPATPSADKPILLVVGSPHLANNNRDLVNARIEDVTTRARQREIEALVDHLARFRPTRVAVEWDAADQTGLDRRYADYRASRISLSANERDQIALRLAAKLDLPQVDAVDWNGDAPGGVPAYDFVTWAARNGRGGILEKLRAREQAAIDERTTAWRHLPVADWYRALNTPEERAASHRVYYEIAAIGDERETPGAAWVGAWYARNLRIFGRLARDAKPGDRVLLLYGSGHAYLLDRFARESSVFEVVDTLTHLPPSGRP